MIKNKRTEFGFGHLRAKPNFTYEELSGLQLFYAFGFRQVFHACVYCGNAFLFCGVCIFYFTRHKVAKAYCKNAEPVIQYERKNAPIGMPNGEAVFSDGRIILKILRLLIRRAIKIAV